MTIEQLYEWVREIQNKYPDFNAYDWIPKRILNDRSNGIIDTYKTSRLHKEEEATKEK